jgi:hypothetical protein
VFAVSIARAFLHGAICFTLLVAFKTLIWVSESKLFFFSGPWASKLASFALLIYGSGLPSSFGFWSAIGENQYTQRG